MFARPPVKTGDRSVYFAFCTLWVGLHSPLPRIPISITGHGPPFPSVTDSSTNLVFHDGGTDDGTISRTWSEITFLEFASSTDHCRTRLDGQPSPKRSSNRGGNLTTKGGPKSSPRGQPIRIPIRRRRNRRDYSHEFVSVQAAKKQSPSIEPRSDPSKIHRFPPLNQNPRRSKTRRSSTSTRVTSSPTSICHSDVSTSNVTGGRGTIDRSTFLSTSKRDSGWSMKRSIRLDSNGLRDHDEVHA